MKKAKKANVRHFQRSTTQDLRTPCPLGSDESEKTTLRFSAVGAESAWVARARIVVKVAIVFIVRFRLRIEANDSDKWKAVLEDYKAMR